MTLSNPTVKIDREKLEVQLDELHEVRTEELLEVCAWSKVPWFTRT